jgi:hypothetical protein
VSDAPPDTEEMRTTTREWRLFKKALLWIAVVAVSGLGTGIVALYSMGHDDGANDERVPQLERRVDRLEERSEWMFRSVFRVPAPPAGGPP